MSDGMTDNRGQKESTLTLTDLILMEKGVLDAVFVSVLKRHADEGKYEFMADMKVVELAEFTNDLVRDTLKEVTKGLR